MDMGIPVEVKTVSVSGDGSIEFFDGKGNSLQPVKATLERSYERAKGPKVLSRIPVDGSARISSDPNTALLAYDTIFSIDTNTRSIGGQEISIAAVVLGKWTQRSPSPILGFAPVHALEFRNVDCHPDLLALKQHIVQMEGDPNRSSAGLIAFIVDSHLGNLSKIASRELPVLDDCFFPEWADLLYASDAAKDSLVNMLLRASDSAANNLLQHIEGGSGYAASQVEAPEHSSYFRVWHFQGAIKQPKKTDIASPGS
ncbi:MAG: hypothetical protein K0M64_11270 [Rhizobium sp.]|nr:hypothetical protein [Rhizobium sp.]